MKYLDDKQALVALTQGKKIRSVQWDDYDCHNGGDCPDRDIINNKNFCTNIGKMSKVYNKLDQKIFTVIEIKGD